MAQDPRSGCQRFHRQPCAPGGNITGWQTFARSLAGKRLELLKEIVPKISPRGGAFGTRPTQARTSVRKRSEAVASASGYYSVHSRCARSQRFRECIPRREGRTDALLVLGVPSSTPHAKAIVELAVKNRLPAMLYQAGVSSKPADSCHYGANSDGLVSPRRHLRRQNSQRRQAGGSAGRAAEEVRVHHQSESSQTDRFDDPAERAGASR